jgi:hypothetical protein
MVGKSMALPLTSVQTRESDTPSGSCSPTPARTDGHDYSRHPNATTPATGEPVSNSVMTKNSPGAIPHQSKCFKQTPSGAFLNITETTETCGDASAIHANFFKCWFIGAFTQVETLLSLSDSTETTSTCGDTRALYATPTQLCATSQRSATLEGLCAPPGSPASPVTRVVG